MKDIVYLNGLLLPSSEAKLSVNDRGFIFGDGVYEVIATYDGRPFEMKRHMDRLRYSLGEISIEGVDIDALGEKALELAAANNLEAAPMGLVYMQITRGCAPRTHAFPVGKVEPTVYMYAAPVNAKWDHKVGAAAITLSDTRWSRCDIKTVSLLANCMANQAAHDAGALEAIFLRDGMALEGTHTSMFVVVDGEVRTAPKSNYILPSITRELVLEICDEAGIPARETHIPEAVLRNADEIFLAGTTTEVLAIVQLDGKPVGDGKPGVMTTRLRQLYSERRLAAV
ncbi:MAG: aminotransferase class IV [Gemmatimonadaceae bacterium]|nr:aminotransferase class IV [Gemmatimonadaceae bacterium]